MTTTRFVLRVSVESAAIVAALAVIAGVFGGWHGAAGVTLGGAVAVVNFWWLAGRAHAAFATAADGRPRVLWALTAALRFAAVAAIAALAFVAGWAHPVALLAGFTVLPCDLIVQGLRAAREPD